MHIINSKKSILLILSLTISISTFAKSNIVIQTWSTKNGAKVLFSESHELPILDLSISFYAGSVVDGKNYGLANLTRATLTAGSKKLTGNQVAERFERLGALFNTYTDRDFSEFSLRTLTETPILSAAVDLFKTVLTEPVFPDNELKRIKNQRLVEIEQVKQSPHDLVYKEFYKELYKNFSYSHAVLGEPNTLAFINRKSLLDFYNKYYNAKNAVIVLVGDVTRKQAEDIAEKTTSKLPKGEKMPLTAGELKNPKAIVKNIGFPATQANVILGQLGVGCNDPDYFSLFVGNSILGGAPFISNLFKEVREKKGFVYTIRSNFYRLLYPAPFIINFSAGSEKADEALKMSIQILKDFLDKGPTEEQLITAKKNLTGRFAVELASNHSILNFLHTIGFYDLPLDYLDTYIDKINAVSVKDIQEAFKRHIDLDHLVVIKVGPK
jgi:zinc protease